MRFHEGRMCTVKKNLRQPSNARFDRFKNNQRRPVVGGFKKKKDLRHRGRDLWKLEIQSKVKQMNAQFLQ